MFEKKVWNESMKQLMDAYLHAKFDLLIAPVNVEGVASLNKYVVDSDIGFDIDIKVNQKFNKHC